MSLVVRWQVPTTSFDRLQSLNRQAYTGCRPVTAGVIDRPLRPQTLQKADRKSHACPHEEWEGGLEVGRSSSCLLFVGKRRDGRLSMVLFR